MAYQFAHIEGYARTAGKGKAGGHDMASIVAEAERAEGACPHIATPAEPVLVYGVAPAEAARIAEEWANQATDARGHKLRKDGLCLLGGVASLPAGTDKREWISFKKLAVKWLQKEYGDRLKSVVEHTDEAHPHLHFYAVPRPGERFDSLHAGLRAGLAADPRRGDRSRDKAESAVARKTSRLAYIEAMRGWQDRFYHAVGRKAGLTRLGPKRQRLSRSGWRAAQHAAAAIMRAEQELEIARQALENERSAIREREAELAAKVSAASALFKTANREKFEVRGLKASKLSQVVATKLDGFSPQEQAEILQAMADRAAKINQVKHEKSNPRDRPGLDR